MLQTKTASVEKFKTDSSSKRLKGTKSEIKLFRSSSDEKLDQAPRKRSNSFVNSSKTSTLQRSLSKDSVCGRIYSKNRNTLRIFDSVPTNAMPPLHIVNQEEVKKRFLEGKIPPILQFKGSKKVIDNILFKHSKPSFKHFFRAKHILEMVRDKYKTDQNAYFDDSFGKRVDSKQCVNIIGKYLVDNKIGGEISINFAPGLTCSGRLTSHNWQKNKPEARKFVVWINDDDANQFLRERGIVCLCDHEIGTHYYRSYNEGLQTWFFDRKKFGLRSLNSIELLRTEEGLAALNTLMNSKLKYLYLPALLYYLVCMAHKMTFVQLYHHMETYIQAPEERWKHVTRVKRGITNPHEIGCYSRDQSYFEGAIEILEKIDSVDFTTLYSGKLCLDEIERVKRLARTDCLKIPKFASDLKSYKDRLKQIAIINGIIRSDGSTSVSKDLLQEGTTLFENNVSKKLSSGEVERYIERDIINVTSSRPINTNNIKQPMSFKKNTSNTGEPQGAPSSLCTLL